LQKSLLLFLTGLLVLALVTPVLAENQGGYVEWTKPLFNDGSASEVYSLIQGINGSYFCVGSIKNLPNMLTKGFLTKADANGVAQWTQIYSDSSTNRTIWLLAGTQTSDGGFALAGNFNETTQPTDGFVYLIKTDSGGNVQWDQTFFSVVGYARSVIQTGDGGYLLACANDRNASYLLKNNLSWTA
jgi:hypothetical protein